MEPGSITTTSYNITGSFFEVSDKCWSFEWKNTNSNQVFIDYIRIDVHHALFSDCVQLHTPVVHVFEKCEERCMMGCTRPCDNSRDLTCEFIHNHPQEKRGKSQYRRLDTCVVQIYNIYMNMYVLCIFEHFNVWFLFNLSISLPKSTSIATPHNPPFNQSTWWLRCRWKCLAATSCSSPRLYRVELCITHTALAMEQIEHFAMGNQQFNHVLIKVTHLYFP